MGGLDFCSQPLEEEGNIAFWRVRIRPGSPPLFGHWNETPMFGLPGNPVSSHVVFRMLVTPYLRRSLGTSFPIKRIVHAKLLTDVRSTSDCLTLRRVTLHSTKEGFLAEQPKHQGSGNIDSLSSADGLTLLQPGQSGKTGEWIEVRARKVSLTSSRLSSAAAARRRSATLPSCFRRPRHRRWHSRSRQPGA